MKKLASESQISHFFPFQHNCSKTCGKLDKWWIDTVSEVLRNAPFQSQLSQRKIMLYTVKTSKISKNSKMITGFNCEE